MLLSHKLTFTRVRKTAKSDYSLRHVCLSAWNGSTVSGPIFMKLDIWPSLENLSRNLQFYWNLTKTTRTLRKHVGTFMTIPRWIILEIKKYFSWKQVIVLIEIGW
jgi:hypothetical protein